MKTLNLDALAKSNRTLTLNGKTHNVLEMTVENFIETTKAADELGEDASAPVQMEATIKMISRSVPSVEPAELRKLTLEQLTTIIKYVRGDFDNADDGVPASESPTEGEPGKPQTP